MENTSISKLQTSFVSGTILEKKEHYVPEPETKIMQDSECPKKVTVKTIAKELGLSFSTVAKAINGDPSVKKSTREIVLRKCDQLGYTPSSAARSLRKQKSCTTTIIFNDLQNPILTKIFDTIALRLQPEYTTNVCDSQFDLKMEKAHILSALASRSDLILIEPASLNDPNFKLLANSTDKTLLFGAKHDFPSSSIVIDYELGGYLAAREMLEHKRFDNAVFSTPAYFPSCAAFLRGIKKAYGEFGKIFDDSRFYAMDSSETPAFTKALELMQDKDRMPEGYITFCDVLAAGVYKAARKNGLSIPKDISVMGHDNYPLSDLLSPGLSTIDIPADTIADNCVTLMKDILSGKVTNSNYFFRPTLIQRESV